MGVNSQPLCKDVEIDVEVTPDPKANKKRISMREEEVDTTKLELKENGSIGSVFSTDNDPTSIQHSVEDYYYDTGICQQIARSSHFANLTVFVVCLNAIYLGIDSDYNDAANIYNANLVFLIISQFFCIYFTLEVVIRLLAFRNKCDSMKDGWFKFDVFLVVTMIADIWVLMPILKVMSGGSAPIPTQPLRMLRLFKLSRMARLMKSFPELVVMIKGLVRSLRAIARQVCLLGS
jgi:hypothetical protein